MIPLPEFEAKSQPEGVPVEQSEPAANSAEANAPDVDPEEIRKKVIQALQTCYDPEIPVNIYELGLVYNIDVSPAGAVNIRMTLTSPFCPAVGSLPAEVQSKAEAVPGVTSAKAELVWEPPWNKDMMSEAAAVELGLY